MKIRANGSEVNILINWDEKQIDITIKRKGEFEIHNLHGSKIDISSGGQAVTHTSSGGQEYGPRGYGSSYGHGTLSPNQYYNGED